jgi:protein-tyrosine kinase
MDRIRRALDLARLERERTSDPRSFEAPPAPAANPAPAVDFSASPAANGPPARISYTCTRVFEPTPGDLERSRIFPPGSVEPAAVAFRMLRTQVLQRMDANGWRTLAIFSPGADDGKTTTAVNLAITLASDHLHTVLLVEFDFKRPTLAGRFGLAPGFGSDDALTGKAGVQDSLYHAAGFERLVIMPARRTIDHSAEMLAGPRGREVVAELRARYPERIVVFDLPPVLEADDALSFAPMVECGLVVAAEGRTRRNDLVRTIELLHKTPLVGTVLNRADEAPTGR